MHIIGFSNEFCPNCQKWTVYFIAITDTDLGQIKVKICEECWKKYKREAIKD